MQHTPSEFRLDITKPSADLTQHLTSDNQRILFSGPFGSGKTTFLKEYFKETKNPNVIHLYPVNYSIASNQDIFELIKHDILFGLLHKNLDYVQHTFSKLLTTQMFLQNNAFDLVKQVAANFGAVGKSISGIADEMMKFIRKNEDFHKTSQVDQKAEIIKYLESFTKKSGTEHEEDAYTQTICELIEQLKAKNPAQETVLIIDDLDRIDPEHIFRILNVFSAHFDLKSGMPNKFGFEKVILVCDINNIRNIFHAKYGAEVDFSGYIDKFYSREVFVFDNKKVMEDSLIALLRSIKLNEVGNNCFSINKTDHINAQLTIHILTTFIKWNAVNLRSLSTIHSLELEFQTYEISLFNEEHFEKHQNISYHLVMVFDFLIRVLGDANSLKKALIKCKNLEKPISSNHISSTELHLISPAIAILSSDNNKAIRFNSFNTYEHTSGAVFEFNAVRANNYSFRASLFPKMIKVGSIQGEEYPVNIYFFQIVYEAFEILQKHELYNNKLLISRK